MISVMDEATIQEWEDLEEFDEDEESEFLFLLRLVLLVLQEKQESGKKDFVECAIKRLRAKLAMVDDPARIIVGESEGQSGYGLMIMIPREAS